MLSKLLRFFIWLASDDMFFGFLKSIGGRDVEVSNPFDPFSLAVGALFESKPINPGSALVS